MSVLDISGSVLDGTYKATLKIQNTRAARKWHRPLRCSRRLSYSSESLSSSRLRRRRRRWWWCCCLRELIFFDRGDEGDVEKNLDQKKPRPEKKRSQRKEREKIEREKREK